MKRLFCVVFLVLWSSAAVADSSTRNATIRGGLSGAASAAIGNGIGGRDGAIIGGATGGGVGAAVATDEDKYREAWPHREHVEYRRQPAYHLCPPGQLKKGRC